MAALAEVDLPTGSLVIADLHLDLDRDRSYGPFVKWLEELPKVPRIVILGDLFEFWNGPSQARTDGGREVVRALRAVTDGGTTIDVIPGNRDFLLDARFEELSGCRVRHAGLVGRTDDGARILFVHGDELATLDRAYQRLRAVLRSPSIRWLAVHLPGGLTSSVARRLRRTSVRAVSAKAPTEMALQADACRTLARRHSAGVVVCGHAHRFHDEELPEGPRWLVLDAFGGRRDALEVMPGARLEPRAAGADAEFTPGG